MVFGIFMDLYGRKSLLLYLVGVVALCVATKIIDEKIEVK